MTSLGSEPLRLDGELAGLEPMTVAHLERYRRAATEAEAMGWGHYFPYLLTQNRAGKSAMLVGEDSGSLCLYRWRLQDGSPTLDLYLPPMPLDLGVLGRCLERVRSFRGDGRARVMRIDAQHAEAIAGSFPRLEVRERRQQYVFAPQNYEQLSGGKLRLVRRNVALLEGRPEVEVLPFTPEHREDCHGVLRRWKQAHRAAHGTAGGATGCRHAIDLLGELPERDLRGEVIRIDGRVVGFCLGGEIRPGLACTFERKCDNDIRGLTYFQFRSMLLGLRDCALANDGSDTGREGLRQLKQSFRSVQMHTEFRARWRD